MKLNTRPNLRDASVAIILPLTDFTIRPNNQVITSPVPIEVSKCDILTTGANTSGDLALRPPDWKRTPGSSCVGVECDCPRFRYPEVVVTAVLVDICDSDSCSSSNSAGDLAGWEPGGFIARAGVKPCVDSTVV
jgi:hypothetical protein